MPGQVVTAGEEEEEGEEYTCRPVPAGIGAVMPPWVVATGGLAAGGSPMGPQRPGPWRGGPLGPL